LLQPGPPHSFLWGHIKIFGKYVTKLPPGGYIQTVVTQIKQDYDLPDIWYLDLWPVAVSFIMMTGPDAAAIPSTLNNFDQADEARKFFVEAHLGSTFIEVTNGSLWKELHSMLAPGLTPAMVKSYHDSMVEDAKGLHGRLRDSAKQVSAVDIQRVFSRYPFDVASTVFFGEKATETAWRVTQELAELAYVSSSNRRFMMNPFGLRKWRKSMKDTMAPFEQEIRDRTSARHAALRSFKGPPLKSSAMCVLDRMLLSQSHRDEPVSERLMELILDK
jgi:cytochrome P450